MFPEKITDLGLAVATDIHLDHAEPRPIKEFIAHSVSLKAKGLTCLVTGDITTYNQMPEHITLLEDAGIKFVLGNHDVWGASFEQARSRAHGLAPTGYLPRIPWVKLKEGTYLVGIDGYFDLKAGRLDLNKFETWDLKYNSSVSYTSRAELPIVEASCRRYCKQDAETLVAKIASLPEDAQTIVIATHVPPFQEVARYRGKPSDSWALPFYVNTILGETLLDLAETYPTKAFICLSGHTHDFASEKIAPNLLCMVNPALYRYPRYAIWA